MNLRAMLLQAAERNPDRVSVVEKSNYLTYGELATAAMRLADSLVSLGVGHGDRVAMSMRNSTEFVVSFCATQMMGAVATPFNFRLKADTINHILNNSGAKALIFDDALDPQELESAVSQHPDLILIQSNGPASPRRYALPDLCTSGQRVVHHTIDRNDLSCIIYTSGTTGLPKGVPLTHRSNYARLITFLMTTGPKFDANGKTFGAAPLYHTVGLHWVLMQTLFTNGTYYPIQKITSEVVRYMLDEGIDFLFGSPTLIRQILREMDRPAEKMRYVCYGSAPTDQSLLDAMTASFPNAQISEVYGTTESSIPFVTPSMAGRKPGTLRTTGDFRVRLIKPAGAPDEEVGPGEFGELIVHTENAGIFERYWGENGDRKAAEKMRDGWLYSGDILTRDEQGNYFFSGRYDDTFVSGGENINPVEIENILHLHPSIEDVAVVGLPDPEWSNVVTAFVVLGDTTAKEEDLDRYCRESSLENFKRPRCYHFVDALPRNPSGKLLRKNLRELAQNLQKTGA